MKRLNTLPSRTRRAFCLLCAGLAVFVGQPAFTSTDDTDLVRTNTANPYVLVILDTSDSMNMTVGTFDWHPLNGDSPESKLYRSKRALYEVFEGIDDVNFGFMTFNHDELRVSSKHWLYGLTEPLALGWPLSYPLVRSGSVTPTDDVFTLGPSFDASMPGVSVDPATGAVEAGSCDFPLDLSNDEQRAKVNRFPKLGDDGKQDTTLWVFETGATGIPGPTYRLVVSAPGIKGATQRRRDKTLNFRLEATLVEDCSFPDAALPPTKQTGKFGFLGEFLMADSGDRFVDSSKKDVEAFAGFWNRSDAQSESVCSDGSPFTGKGLESNYDDPDFVPPPEAGFSGAEKKLLTDDDEFCQGKKCRNVKFSTQIDPVYPEIRELDRGDFIPYHWSISAKDEFLRRLNPKHGTLEPPDYGVASYFADTLDPLTGTLPLKNANQRPIIATGPTPFGKAVNDYRCWYLGPKVGPAGKCRESSSKLSFETGWEEVARTRDPDFNCRRPYVILISDGEDTCGGENVSADINDFDAFGVRTWILNVGGDDAEKRFTAIIANANAELINVNEGDQLKQELLDILGEISSETRAFATAAVPSVQVEADDKILLTSFNPLQDSSIWAGNALAFLKPLPTKEEPAGSGRFVADTSTVCDATTTSGCFLWDAGEVIKTQVNIADPVGPAVTQRRVYYPQAPSGVGLPMARGELEGSTASGPGSTAEKDLWNGLGIPFTDGLTTSE
ncbi:MAG: VWA domain-containing protein, partial [Acidobacteria bacterium]|nr:VWA domain-containing protein [Acidobacteriota bacterium]